MFYLKDTFETSWPLNLESGANYTYKKRKMGLVHIFVRISSHFVFGRKMDRFRTNVSKFLIRIFF